MFELEGEMPSLSVIAEMHVSGELSDEETRYWLDRIAAEQAREPWLQTMLRELFPSLFERF
jgi:hypothetical protein